MPQSVGFVSQVNNTSSRTVVAVRTVLKQHSSTRSDLCSWCLLALDSNTTIIVEQVRSVTRYDCDRVVGLTMFLFCHVWMWSQKGSE